MVRFYTGNGEGFAQWHYGRSYLYWYLVKEIQQRTLHFKELVGGLEPLDFISHSAFVLNGFPKRNLNVFVAIMWETTCIVLQDRSRLQIVYSTRFRSLEAILVPIGPGAVHLHDPIVESLHSIRQSKRQSRKPWIPVALVIEFFRAALPSVSVDHL